MALKFLAPSLTRDPDAIERFKREPQAASALDHKNICTIHAIEETEEGGLFIAMSCYVGETIKARLARGRLTPAEALDLVSQVAEGLARAHGAGITHRDVKPANILVASDGEVKILDFGLAKMAGQTQLTQTGSTVGTVSYMSSEQARGEDLPMDIRCAGVVTPPVWNRRATIGPAAISRIAGGKEYPASLAPGGRNQSLRTKPATITKPPSKVADFARNRWPSCVVKRTLLVSLLKFVQTLERFSLLTGAKRELLQLRLLVGIVELSVVPSIRSLLE